MVPEPRGSLCERARVWAALAPDGELAELERKLLDAHLERCGACREFAVDVAAVASELRAASLDALTRPVSVTVWRRRPVYARARAVGAAAAVALMALGITAREPLSTDGGSDLPRVTNFTSNAEWEVALILRRAENDNARELVTKLPAAATRPI